MTKSYLKSSILSVCLLVLTAGFHQVSQATEQRITATGNGSVSAVPGFNANYLLDRRARQ